MSILPVKEKEFFEIRFHSIGGQGAYTTGQMIATLASEIPEIKSAVFASYGSEKKGAPVNVFVRFLESKEKIKNYAAVRHPNIVIVFHENLLKTQNVEVGLVEEGTVIVNTDLSPEQVRENYNLTSTKIICVDGTKIALETKAKVNTVIYGTLLKELNFLNIDKAAHMIEEKLSYKYPHLVNSNIEAMKRGYEETNTATFDSEKKLKQERIAQRLGYKTQINGGIILGANAQNVDRSISREGMLPKFNKEACINCTKCDMTCPDDCFVWQEVEGRRGRMQMELQGIDYKHCKGCLRCVEVCPTEALTEFVEPRGYAQEHTVSHNYKEVK